MSKRQMILLQSLTCMIASRGTKHRPCCAHTTCEDCAYREILGLRVKKRSQCTGSQHAEEACKGDTRCCPIAAQLLLKRPSGTLRGKLSSSDEAAGDVVLGLDFGTSGA
eukprot:2910853-Amphidinium_carterae.1